MFLDVLGDFCKGKFTGGKMPSPQGLQPVLKMKVDELFLNWLSEPNIQVMLKDYLRKIKNGDELEFGKGTGNFTENNNTASNYNVTERTSASLGAPCSPPSATLPSGSGSSNRAGPNSRALRRSVSVKKVKTMCFSLTWLCIGKIYGKFILFTKEH